MVEAARIAEDSFVQLATRSGAESSCNILADSLDFEACR
jgi:hypothetical protein